MLIFQQNHKVISAHAANDFFLIQKIEDCIHILLKNHIAVLCAGSLIDIIEILDIQKCPGILFQQPSFKQIGAELDKSARIHCTGENISYCKPLHHLNHSGATQKNIEILSKKL